jgi:hypothetical protein
MKFTKTMLTTIFLIAALASAGSTVFAQKQTGAGDKVLAPGDYAIKQSDINALARFYEWLLGVEFTSAQRQRFQTLMTAEARARKSTAKAVAEIVEGFRKIQTADAEKRAELRGQLLPEIIAALEKEESELNNMLLEIYRGAQTETPDADAMNDSQKEEDRPADSTGRGGVKVADLAGLWSTSSVSGERYKSLVTGELSDPSGSIIEYQISPNGAIKHVGYLSVTTYSCTSKLFISRTGRISISGSNITFDFAAGKRMYQTCGSAMRNDTLPAERKTSAFRLQRDKYGVELCTIDENGKDLCFRKKGD